MNAHALMAQRFGPEWQALSRPQRALIVADFSGLLLEAYDTPDDTMDDWTAEENAHAASFTYRGRIGGGNLAAYVASLEAGERVRAQQLERLAARGFDACTASPDGVRVRCSQCEALCINGTPTHERGCPNQ